jgi:hypothetical protein
MACRCWDLSENLGSSIDQPSCCAGPKQGYAPPVTAKTIVAQDLLYVGKNFIWRKPKWKFDAQRSD